MKGFARATKLTNIGGRADYISSPDRQEEILAKSAPVDWEPYQRFEQANQKTATRNNEGREVVVALPNDWARLRRAELTRRVDQLASMIVGPGREAQWAVHWNKARTNLHVHVIFSERQRIADPGRWDRDVYRTEDGKIARRKADRAKGPDGKELPPVHRKGELKEGFTAKDTRFKERGWLHDLKGQLQTEMQQRWRVKFDEKGLLHEYHEGKGNGKEATRIREKNEAIRATNRNYAEYLASHPDMKQSTKEFFEQTARRAARRGEVVTIEWSPDLGAMVGTKGLAEWREAAAKGSQTRAVPEGPQKAPESPVGLLGRVREGMSSFAAKRAEKAAQRAAEAEAKRQAEEQARKAAEAAEAAQRAAAAAERQARAAAIADLREVCEKRWQFAEQYDLRGWKSLDAERAMASMREGAAVFPLVHKDDFGWRVKIFKADEWREAKALAASTEGAVKERQQRGSGQRTLEQVKAMEQQRPRPVERTKEISRPKKSKSDWEH